MRGLEPLKAAVLAMLVANIDRYCQAVATDLDVDVDEVGPPQVLLLDQVAPPRRWPAVEITQADIVRMTRTEIDRDTGDLVYERRYRLRIAYWTQSARQGDSVDAARRRDRLERALLECLLDNQTLDAGQIAIDDTTFTGEYSPPLGPVEGREASGGYIDFELVQIETLSRAPLAEPPLTLDIEATAIPWED